MRLRDRLSSRLRSRLGLRLPQPPRLALRPRLRLIPLLFGLALGALSAAACAQTGTAVPALAEYDRQMQLLMDKWKINGATLAVVRSEKLLFARGYGVADKATGAPMQPDALMRTNSTTTALLSAVVLKLAAQGLISLDRPVFPLLNLGTPTDPRIDKITARNLLEQTSGWDTSMTGGELIYLSRRIASEMGVPSPPDSDTVVRWALRQPLQFEPGSRFGNASQNYEVLSALVAKVTGQRYQDVARTLLLSAGITRMRPAASLPAGRQPGEAAYEDLNVEPVPSVFDSVPGLVPWAYGGFAMEPFEPFIGWLGSAVDLAALGAALNGINGRPDFLSAAGIAEMRAKPSYATSTTSQWRAKGWTVNSNTTFNGGPLPGSYVRMFNRLDGVTWVAMFNTLPAEGNFSNEVDVAMQAATASVSKWPTDDQFPALLGAGPITGCYGVPSFFDGKLCIPSVSVPNGATSQRFTAVLDLVDAASYTFRLSSAIPALDASSAEASFDPAKGTVNLSRVVLPDADGKPQAFSVQLSVVPGGEGLTLRLSGATLLPG